MTDLFQVRPIAAEEWRSYKRVRLQALQESPNAFSTTLADMLQRSDDGWANRTAEAAASDNNYQLFAEVDGEPVGLAGGWIDSATPDLAHLFQVWVAPEYRCLGIGQKLVEMVIEWAKTKHVSNLELGVTLSDPPESSPARRLYERLGFEIFGEPEPLRPGSELLIQAMRMRLEGMEKGDG